MNKATDISVLCVDDEPVIRELVTEIFLRSGHRVVTAPSVEDAKSLLTRSSFDVVLTDLDQYKQKGIGYTLLEHVSQHYPTLPVMVMTGRPIDDPRSELAADVVMKPFNNNNLVKRAERVAREYATRALQPA